MRREDLTIKIWCDSGDVKQIREWVDSGTVSGVTSNPSLCRKAGVTDYLSFCREAVEACKGMPLSLEVIADDAPEIARQAKLLAGLGSNVYVKVPIVNTSGQLNTQVIRTLNSAGVPVNITAVFGPYTINAAVACLGLDTPSIISVFAGRIADAGGDPGFHIHYAKWNILRRAAGEQIKVLWASVREPYNIIEAENAGADIITVFPEVLKKLHLFGKDLTEFAIETSQMFFRDAIEAGYRI